LAVAFLQRIAFSIKASLLLTLFCEPFPEEGKDTICISKKVQIFSPPHTTAIYATNMMVFRDWDEIQDPPPESTLTLGVNISAVFQENGARKPI